MATLQELILLLFDEPENIKYLNEDGGPSTAYLLAVRNAWQPPYTAARLQEAFASVEGGFAETTNYRNAYNAFYANHFEIAPCYAVETILDKAFAESGIDGGYLSASALEKALRLVGPGMLPKSRVLVEREAAERDAATIEERRQELINAISVFGPSTDGRSYTGYGEYGTANFYPIEDLHTMDVGQLSSIYAPIEARQRLKYKSAAEIREEMKAASAEKQQQQGQENQSAVEGYQLIKPDTEPPREYTKVELIRVINGDRGAMRALVTLPSGRSRPGSKEAIERILRS